MKANKILFVDDDKEILQNYLAMFTKKKESNSSEQLNDLFGNNNIDTKTASCRFVDYEVEVADQGAKAVEIAKKAFHEGTPFKVAFIDMRMPPGIDGKETAKRLRELDPSLEIVIVTAYSDHDLNTLVNDIGHPDKLLYIKKPFDPVEIKQCALSLTTKWNEAQIKDEFLANISHELKTPLASIIGFADIIQEEKDISKEVQQYSRIIKNNGKMLKFLVDDLITMVRLGKSSVTINKSEVNLNDLLLEVIHMFEPMVSIKDAFELRPNLSEESLIANVDKDRFLQCFINLLSNAIKYTPEGHAEIISQRNENGEIEIIFKDSGIGIEPQDLEVIFEKFERLEKDHHAIPGLGLGLSICKKIIDLHGARLEVRSIKNEGSEFKIIIEGV